MVPLYSQLIKVLGPYLKEETVYPPEGLGPGTTPADKAVRGLKLLAKYYIEKGNLDEVAAIDGTRPLEQIADSSGIAWGGMCIQIDGRYERIFYAVRSREEFDSKPASVGSAVARRSRAVDDEAPPEQDSGLYEVSVLDRSCQLDQNR